VRPAVDHCAAHAANALTAIVIECDRFIAVQRQLLIHNVDHFQEGHVRGNILRAIGLKASLAPRTALPPDFEREIDDFGHL
jgi:hypothetical protein